jgi:hypothetical protein
MGIVGDSAWGRDSREEERRRKKEEEESNRRIVGLWESSATRCGEEIQEKKKEE